MLAMGMAVKEEKSASTCTHKLAADDSIPPGLLLKHLRVRALCNFGIHEFFINKSLMQQLAEFIQTPPEERLLHLENQIIDSLHSVQCSLSALAMELDLFFDEALIDPDLPRVAQQQVSFQVT